MKLWVVGQFFEESIPANKWAFVGVFDTEEAAIAACTADNYCILPATLNEVLPEEVVVWPGGYYPRLESKPE